MRGSLSHIMRGMEAFSPEAISDLPLKTTKKVKITLLPFYCLPGKLYYPGNTGAIFYV